MRIASYQLFAILLLSSLSIQAQEVRSYDGSNNNLVNSTWGQIEQPFMNYVPLDYTDGISMPTGLDRPNPRFISTTVFTQDGFVANEKGVSDFGWSFGQFIDHDITFNDDSHASEDFLPIQVPQCDEHFDEDCEGGVLIPMKRSKFMAETGTSADNPRRHVNSITPFIDGSGVYGSDEAKANWLRSFVDGKLKVSEGNFLPYNTVTGEMADAVDENAPFMLIEGEHPPRHFIAGDLRANEQPTLAAMHTLFVREHNRLCDELKTANPLWDDEKLYQEARRRVGALIQSIVYYEWLPALGITLNEYNGYSPSMNPSILNVFSASAFRLGHTLVNEQLIRLDDAGDTLSFGTIHLKDAFFNPFIITEEGGLEPIFKGMASQKQQRFDTKVVGTLRNFLFGAPGAGGLDLVSLNIQRGRERGLCDYNTIRESFNLPRMNNFSDISSDVAVSSSIALAYEGDINNIDPWIGMMAEDHVNGSVVGELVFTILKMQFQNLRDGDRFYFENDIMLSAKEKELIKNTKMADIIRRNTNISSIQDDVFFAKSHSDVVSVEIVPFDNIRAVDINAYPNPAVDRVVLSVYSTEAETATLDLIDAKGQVVFSEKVTIQGGHNTFEYQLKQVVTGNYIVRLTSETGVGSVQLIKQ